ncbi:hypothetical protein EG68_03754 [Paragonimus skrjabini miyazakii]|uniref:Uncharacterized protein n=1 Tax=Paragonimus skrjabini miyazakii TaxID=59628 RepID=A0A8S9YW99_9TREM|nr:hypothetical protein EG68_03754 [Paragonimus skrjabini miyazakii]
MFGEVVLDLFLETGRNQLEYCASPLVHHLFIKLDVVRDSDVPVLVRSLPCTIADSLRKYHHTKLRASIILTPF